MTKIEWTEKSWNPVVGCSLASVSEVEGPGEHFHFPDGATVRRTGKKRSGRRLDGVLHDAMPAQRAPAKTTETV